MIDCAEIPISTINFIYICPHLCACVWVHVCLCMCVCVCALLCVCQCLWRSEDRSKTGVCFLFLLPCGFRRLDSGCEVWWQVPLPDGSSCWFLSWILLNIINFIPDNNLLRVYVFQMKIHCWEYLSHMSVCNRLQSAEAQNKPMEFPQCLPPGSWYLCRDVAFFSYLILSFRLYL